MTYVAKNSDLTTGDGAERASAGLQGQIDQMVTEYTDLLEGLNVVIRGQCHCALMMLAALAAQVPADTLAALGVVYPGPPIAASAGLVSMPFSTILQDISNAFDGVQLWGPVDGKDTRNMVPLASDKWFSVWATLTAGMDVSAPLSIAYEGMAGIFDGSKLYAQTSAGLVPIEISALFRRVADRLEATDARVLVAAAPSALDAPAQLAKLLGVVLRIEQLEAVRDQMVRWLEHWRDLQERTASTIALVRNSLWPRLEKKPLADITNSVGSTGSAASKAKVASADD